MHALIQDVDSFTVNVMCIAPQDPVAASADQDSTDGFSGLVWAGVGAIRRRPGIKRPDAGFRVEPVPLPSRRSAVDGIASSIASLASTSPSPILPASSAALSPAATLNRVRRLKEAGVIAGVRANVDPKQAGFPLQVYVAASLTEHDRRILRSRGQQP